MGSQIGHRWLREQNYVEDNVVNTATRVLNDSIVDQGNLQDYVNNDTVDIETHISQSQNTTAESGDNVNLLVTQQNSLRTVTVNKVQTRKMTPVERHNHLLRESKCLAEVASRTPVHTHVSSMVLSALTKAMSGHDTAALTTVLEALLGERPSMVGYGQKKAVKGIVND